MSGRALGLLLLGLLTLLLEAPERPAQSPRKAFRIGFPSESSATASTATMEAFRQGLRELGYLDGQNVAIEWRFAEGGMERLAQLAADLGGGDKVDVVVTPDNQAARSLRIATQTVPIILAGADLRWGLIENLARPGRNISGLSSAELGLRRPGPRVVADVETHGEGVCRRREVHVVAVAIRENATVLHNDDDFEVLVRHTRLRTERYRVLRPVPAGRSEERRVGKECRL